MPYPAAPQVVLYDQLNNPGTIAINSQDFEPAFADLSDLTADNFVVPAGQTWNITEVDVGGVYSRSWPGRWFNVFFYENSGGLPGAQVYSAFVCPYVNDSGVFEVILSAPAVLGPGTYWVSVQARMDSSP